MENMDIEKKIKIDTINSEKNIIGIFDIELDIPPTYKIDRTDTTNTPHKTDETNITDSKMCSILDITLLKKYIDILSTMGGVYDGILNRPTCADWNDIYYECENNLEYIKQTIESNSMLCAMNTSKLLNYLDNPKKIYLLNSVDANYINSHFLDLLKSGNSFSYVLNELCSNNEYPLIIYVYNWDKNFKISQLQYPYGLDYFIFRICGNKNLHMMKWLFNVYYDENNEELIINITHLKNIYRQENDELFKYMYNKISIKTEIERFEIIKNAIGMQSVDIIKYLCQNNMSDYLINNIYLLFKNACFNNNISIAEYFYSINKLWINRCIELDDIFEQSCYKGYPQIIDFLQTKCIKNKYTFDRIFDIFCRTMKFQIFDIEVLKLLLSYIDKDKIDCFTKKMNDIFKNYCINQTSYVRNSKHMSTDEYKNMLKWLSTFTDLTADNIDILIYGYRTDLEKLVSGLTVKNTQI